MTDAFYAISIEIAVDETSVCKFRSEPQSYDGSYQRRKKAINRPIANQFRAIFPTRFLRWNLFPNLIELGVEWLDHYTSLVESRQPQKRSRIRESKSTFCTDVEWPSVVRWTNKPTPESPHFNAPPNKNCIHRRRRCWHVLWYLHSW